MNEWISRSYHIFSIALRQQYHNISYINFWLIFLVTTFILFGSVNYVSRARAISIQTRTWVLSCINLWFSHKWVLFLTLLNRILLVTLFNPVQCRVHVFILNIPWRKKYSFVVLLSKVMPQLYEMMSKLS